MSSPLWEYHQVPPISQILIANLLEMVSCSITCQMGRNIKSTGSFQKCIACDGSLPPGEVCYKENVFLPRGRHLGPMGFQHFWWRFCFITQADDATVLRSSVAVLLSGDCPVVIDGDFCIHNVYLTPPLILIVLSWLDRRIESGTEILPSFEKRGEGTLPHSFNCPPTPRIPAYGGYASC